MSLLDELRSNAEYWIQRFAALEEQTHERSKAYIERVEKQFDKALSVIRAKISTFYHQFAELEGVSLAEARKILDAGELKEFKMSVEEYIKLGESLNENFDPEVLKRLKKASIRVRVSRLEALEYFMEAEVTKLYSEMQVNMFELLGQVYENRYYQTAWIFDNMGYEVTFDGLNMDQINAALEEPWSGANFSERIWNNRDKLQKTLSDVMTQSVMLGRSYTDTTRLIAKAMDVSSANAARLVTTERAAIASMGQKRMYDELKCQQYTIVATLDNRTSQICQSLDGKVFDMKDFQVGATAPPFHPHCRTTTAPYFEDYKPKQRAARGKNGKTEYVENVPYREWAKKNGIEPVYGLWDPDYGTSHFEKYRGQNLIKVEGFKETEGLYNNWGLSKKATHISYHKGVPQTFIPNAIIDRIDKTEFLVQRSYYDSEGWLKWQYDLTDHGSLKKHPYVPHLHIYKWDKKTGKKISRKLVERKLNQKEWNYINDIFGFTISRDTES